MVANMIEIHGSLRCVTAIHNSATAINVPTTGVQRPMTKSIAAHAPIMCGIIDAEKRRVCELDNTEANEHDGSDNALHQKSDSWPTVSKRRIKSLQDPSLQIVKEMARRSEDLKVGSFFLLLGRIQLDDAALQPNGYGVGSIVGTKLRQYICNVTLDGRFANRKLIGNLFICVAGCNQPQNVDFTFRQGIIGSTDQPARRRYREGYVSFLHAQRGSCQGVPQARDP